mmetsp:Transcript_49940/g.139862  ORF Transcript_49940/g.139862 Transcript_49940/m.139862 type:complete len:761 (-) Transcript_49940:79-2361(-)
MQSSLRVLSVALALAVAVGVADGDWAFVASAGTQADKSDESQSRRLNSARLQLKGGLRRARDRSSSLRTSAAKTSSSTAASEANYLRARLAAEDRELASARRLAQAAAANATKANAAVDAVSRAAQKDRLGLLEQISALGEQFSSAQRRLADSEQRERGVESRAAAETASEQLRLQRLKSETDQRLASFGAQLRMVRANLTAERGRTSAARGEAASLDAQLRKTQQRLHIALVDRSDIHDAQVAAAQEVADLRQRLAKDDEALAAARDEATEFRSNEAALKSKLAASDATAAELERRKRDLESEVEALNASSAAIEARSQRELRNTMLKAADKIHEFEDRDDSLRAALQANSSALASAMSENDMLRSKLQQEMDAAREASQREEFLSHELDDTNNSAREAAGRVVALTQEVAALGTERDRLSTSARERVTEVSSLRSELQERSGIAENSAKKVKSLEQENRGLRAQVLSLSGEDQRADELADELAALRSLVARNASHETALTQQLQRVRDLKDEYSQEYEAAENQTNAWQERAEALAAKLNSSEASARALAVQRDRLADEVREARSQEDEYFEENSQLRQQSEALASKLRDATTSASRNADAANDARAELEQRKSDEARDQENSRAAWVSNQREMMQLRGDIRLTNDVKDRLQAELERTQAVLTNEQRHALGLSVPRSTARALVAHRAGAVSGSARARGTAATRTPPTGRGPSPLTAVQAAPLRGAGASHGAAEGRDDSAGDAGSALQKLTAYFTSAPRR